MLYSLMILRHDLTWQFWLERGEKTVDCGGPAWPTCPGEPELALLQLLLTFCRSNSRFLRRDRLYSFS